VAENRDPVQDRGNPRKGDASRAFLLRGGNVMMTLGLASNIRLTLPGELLVNGGTQHSLLLSTLTHWTAERAAFFRRPSFDARMSR
jgi:hypothetical protein